MENQNNIYVQILNMFVSNDEYRPWTHKPFNYGSNTLATDAHILVATPLQEGYELIDKTKGVYPVDKNMDIKILINDLKSELDNFPKIDCYDTTIGECPKCDGEGTIECEHCGSEYECPECNGTGEAEITSKEPNGKKELNPEKYFKIGKCCFNPKYVQKIFDVAKLLDSEYISVVRQTEENRITLFNIKDIDILLMPVYINDERNIATTIICNCFKN